MPSASTDPLRPSSPRSASQGAPPDTHSSRRGFLKATALTGAGLAFSPWASATVASGAASAPQEASQTSAARSEEASFEISLAQWSLHRAHFEGRMSALDFARTAKGLGIHAIEYVNAFFKDRATDFDYLSELKAQAIQHDVRSLLIMIDGEGELAHPDQAARRTAIRNHLKWIAAASFLGCHAIRVNAAGSGEPDAMRDRAADSLHQLADYGEPYGIHVIVENHGGLSSDGGWLASVMQAADHPGVGTLPDFGNFRIDATREYDRYLGVEELMPYAKAVSAKSYDFDADGSETSIDFLRMLKLVQAAGYHGFVGIEYEGSRLPEEDGIKATKSLLEKVRAELS